MPLEKYQWKEALMSGAIHKTTMTLQESKMRLASLPPIPKINWPPLPILKRKNPQEYLKWIAANHADILQDVCRAKVIWEMRKAILDNTDYRFSTTK